MRISVSLVLCAIVIVMIIEPCKTAARRSLTWKEATDDQLVRRQEKKDRGRMICFKLKCFYFDGDESSHLIEDNNDFQDKRAKGQDKRDQERKLCFKGRCYKSFSSTNILGAFV